MGKIRPDEDLLFHTGMDKQELEGWRDGIKQILEMEPNASIHCHHPELLVYLANAELENMRFREVVQAAMWNRE